MTIYKISVQYIHDGYVFEYTEATRFYSSWESAKEREIQLGTFEEKLDKLFGKDDWYLQIAEEELNKEISSDTLSLG